MPSTDVLFFADDEGSCPLLEWLDRQAPKVQDKCIVRIERLAEMGHELRRPEAAPLRDGIYELRTRQGRVHYRLLYFFHRGRAVVTHGLSKEGVVPNTQIELALSRRALRCESPAAHLPRVGPCPVEQERPMPSRFFTIGT